MEAYLFYGIVLPERAQLSLQFAHGFSHLTSGNCGQVKVNVILNQVAVWVESEHEWNILELRNIVKSIVQNHLAMVGYFKGYAYDLEVTRVLNQSRGVDHMFGIDIPCLAERGKAIDLNDAMAKLIAKTIGPNGVFLHRCFNDLISSMKHAYDTSFYCYRAIEALRHHCAALNGLSEAEKPKQWEKFREVSGCEEQTLRTIKEAADPLRHGEVSGVDSNEREMLFTSTWDIVEGYLKSI